MHLKCRLLHIFVNIITYVSEVAISVEPDQTAPTGAV